MQKDYFFTPISIKELQVTAPFWCKMLEKVRAQVIPYQWEALNDRIEGAKPSHCIQNFEIAAGLAEGEFNGPVFQDSDLYKWLEAVGYSLSWHPDDALENLADEAIELICAAQQADGYLNTYYSINGLDKRFTNLKDNHELYCLGHLIEGAIAYYKSTGKEKLLQAAIRFVDFVDLSIGLEDNKLHGYPGHSILEMALMRLYEVTKNEKHKKLAKYFVDQRGQEPLYFEEETNKNQTISYWSDSHFQYQYYQAGKPVRQQTKAEGHAVRAVYLYSGMADVAREYCDEELFQACEALWKNIEKRQSYITGAIGQSAYGESFTCDYDLPNGTAYAETCAQIGLVFFARRMLQTEPNRCYSDLMERTLFNGVLSGMSLDGKSFFYVNPLEIVPEYLDKDHALKHVKVQRQKWFGCACCPPNIARLLASVQTYAHTLREDALYTHLYIGADIEVTLAGKNVGVKVTTGYPWEKTISIGFSTAEPSEFTYAIRIPSWCKKYKLTLNGKEVKYDLIKGYATLFRRWRDGDILVLSLEMPVRLIHSNSNVRDNIGKVAVQRGPLVYCLEEADNGPDLHRIFLSEKPVFTERFDPDFLGGIVTLSSDGLKLCESEDDSLYTEAEPLNFSPKKLKWIPYFTWANRTPGEMLIWVRR